MRFHLATSRVFDFDAIQRDSELGKTPRNLLGMLVRRLNGTVQQPVGHRVTPLDRIRAKIVGRPEFWALARTLASQLGRDDVIFCSGEDIGIPIAAVCGGRRHGPKVIVYLHNIDRPRGRVALQLFRIRDRVDLFIGNVQHQLTVVRDLLRLPESRTRFFIDQTDIRFFTPGPATLGQTRPVIASVGLEHRDYRTLAAATADLDVDVRISGFSEAAAIPSRAFPESPPANMVRRFYPWPELVQLYRDADLVAISLFPCKFAAGLTTIMEATACRRPVVVTRSEGLADYVTTPDTLCTTPLGDPAALRQAIVELLENRTKAEEMASRGYTMAQQRFDSDRYVEAMAECVLELGPGKPVPTRQDVTTGQV